MDKTDCFAFGTVADKDAKDAVWSLWQTLIGELQWRPLGILEQDPDLTYK